MYLDVITLIAAGSFVTALCAVLLTGAWTQMRSAPALLWWAAAMYLLATGIGLLAYGNATASPSVITVGTALSAVNPLLVLAGVRTFVHRRVRRFLIVAGIAVLAASAGILLAVGGVTVAIDIEFAVWIVCLSVSNWELWRARSERLMARWPLMAIFTLHAFTFAGGIYDTLFDPVNDIAAPALDSWFGLINFEAIVYSAGAAIFMVLLCKERLESGYIRAAESDPLTGIANRRAFFAGAERLLDRCRAGGTPLSVIEFDLDGFKSINDAHGHAVGDEVLRMFVASTRGVLRPNDFFGRHGGEEFAVVLPGATVETAFVIAERACHAFAEASREIDGRALYATVSAGVAAAALGEVFSAALAAADRALYGAKHHGRNRVERADNNSQPAANGATVIRVA